MDRKSHIPLEGPRAFSAYRLLQGGFFSAFISPATLAQPTMTMTTVSDVPALLRCKGACKQSRPLFDFYAAGTNNTNPRSVCKACWKAVNARAYQKRQEQGQRRRALLCISTKFKRP